MAFDVREYVKKRAQDKANGNNESNSGFDVQGYVKQKNLPQVGEYLNSSINSWLKKNNSFINSYNSRYSGENSSYRTDASDWLSTVTTRKSELENEAKEIRTWLDQYKDYLDKDYYDSVTSALDGNMKAYGDIISNSTKDLEFWSQFDSEDTYNAWLEKQRADEEYKNWFKNVDADKSSQGWQKYLTDDEERKNTAMYGKEDEKWYETLGRWFGGGTPDASLPTAATTYAINGLREDDSYKRPNDDWTEEQRNVFGELYLESPETAYMFAEETNRRNNESKEETALKVVFDSATSSFGAGLGHTIGAIVAAPFGLADYLNDLAYANAGREIAPDGQVSPFEYSQAVTSGISTHLNEQGGTLNENIPIIGGKGWGDVYGLGTSIAQSMVSAYTLGGAGTLVSYFGQGAAAGMDDALSRGATEGQAALYGTALGVFEGVAESIGIDNLFKLGSSTTIKGFIKNILKQAGAEGAEEGLTSVLGNIADAWVMQDKSNFNKALQSYMSEGMSESDAKWKVFWDSLEGIAFDTIAGAASGGISGGIHTTVQNIGHNIETTKQGQGIIDRGGVDSLKQLALDMSGATPGGDSKKLANLASKVETKASAKNVGKLSDFMGDTISAQNRAEIETALTEKGLGKKDAKRVSEYLNKASQGYEFSDAEIKEIEGNENIAKVLLEVVSDTKSPLNERTKNFMLAKLGISPSTTESSKSPMNVFDQHNIGNELKKLASEVATGSRTSLAGQALKRSVDSASASATEKLGVEGKYSSSDTGATRLASNKKKVNIVGVDSIENGALKLKLDDGSIVDADEIDFSTSDEALVYEAVTNMGVSSASAWEILKGYNPKSGQSGTIYAMGALEAYTYGHNGVKVDGMSKDGFSALLSPTQKNTANRLGDIDARAKVEAKQKTIDKALKTVRDEARSKHKAIPKRKGEVVFDGDRARLTDLQEKQLGVLEKVSEGLGVTFHIFESKVDGKGKRHYTMPDGKITSANGWYDPKTGEIWIDLYAGNDGQGTMIFTAAHELTHFIRQWSPAKFKVFADFLFEQYGKKGQDVNQLIRDQIKKAADNGRSISWDEAYEEVVADSAETFLRDSKAAEKIAALREKDAGLANKIKSFLGQMLAKMRKVLADLGLAPETKEGKMVAEMTDSLQKLYDLWTDALADAGTAYSTLADIDLDTESVAPMLSERTWTASEYVTEREATAKKISEALGVDMKTAYKYIDDINSVARLIADDRARLDYEPNLDDNATVLKPNSEYKYSVDMSTLCAKRLLFTGTFDAIQKALPNTVFDSEDIVALREMMQDRGYEVACGICYVESTRREIGRITQEFIDRYKVAQETGKPISRINSSGKEVVLKSAGKTFSADKNYTPNLGELNTTDIDIVKRDHPEVYDAYLAFMNARGQAKPKLLETRAEYKGEILKHFKARSAVEARNNAGGLRLQSFSDFEVPHLIDMMQIVMDMSRVGLKSQAYTKVPAFAEVFGDTGVKINLSLIAKGDGLDANGNLVFDDVEGINHEEAFKLRDKYSKNVGTILVGKTDAHIMAAMADPRIDYIIPFHKSSWKESLYDALGLTGYADYTDFQNEKPIDKDRKIKNFDPSEYWDFSKSGDENAQIYLAKCREDGRIPKFPQFQGYPGYWKLLIDFKMYDNDGVGSPQEVVRPTFNTEASEKILSEYKGGHRNFPVAKDVVEDFVREHKDNEVRYSFRDSKNGMANDALIPYNEEQTRFINQRGDYIIDSFEKLIEVVNLAFDQPDTKAIAHFGMVDAETLQKIKNSIPNLPESMDTLFTDNKGYSIATTLDGIRHIVKEKQLTRQDVIDYLDRFADTIVEYDEVDFHYYTRRGRQMPGLLFRKDFPDGKYVSFDLVSQEKQSLLLQSLYIDSVDYEKRKSANPVLMQNASASTSKTRGGQTSTNRIAQKPNSVNRDTEKNSLRNVEPIEAADYVKMYHHFGSTKNYDVAGYILGNGIMLDFSGKHWGDDYSTSRQVDHRDIQETLGNRGSNNGVNAMIDMIGNGNIRLMPEVGGINLAVKPNSTQMSQLRGYINHFKGEVEIDIDEVGGDTVHSFSYPRGTSSTKVLADIKAYFDEGIVPKQKDEGETDIRQFLFSEREAAPPTNTKKAYKLMRLVDGKLYPLFIGNNEEISVGTWYNADSPNLSQLKNLAPGTHLVDMKTGEAMTWDEYAEKYVPKKNGKPARNKPSKDDVHWANDNGYRFMHIEEKAGGKSEGTMLKKYGDTRAYYNWGVNGSSKTESGEGSASLYALRPGWHFGEVPSMHQIGYDGEDGETVRLDNQVWVEVEMSADVDYNAEAEANWSGDIPTHIPTNGYYRYATNPTQKKTKGGNTANDATKADWFVAGAFKVNRILSDSEADSIVENYNKANGKNVPLDYRRNYGRVFNAETMSIEDSARYSDRSPDSVSTRTLLANALETTAQNDIERTKLEQYKSKIELIESEYAKLSEIKKKANDIRFTKGRTAAETKQMKALDFEANQIANRINVYDRQLLNLESTTALKNVLQREKELARRKEAKKGKEALARQKEREAKTIRTLMDKNTESRKKALERADKTTMRRKIRKVVKELNTLLKNSNKKKNIKEEEKTTVATALALAEVLFNDDIKNEDIVRLGVDSVTEAESILLNEYRDLLDSRDALIAKIESTHGNGIVKENTLTEVGSIEESLAKVKNRISTLNSKLSEVFERERARLNKSTMNAVFDALITEYSNLANSDNDYIKNAYSEVMKTRLETLKKDLDGKIAKDMSIHQLAEVYDTFKAIKYMISTSNNIFREGRAEDLATYVSNTQGEIYESTTESKDRGVVADAFVSAFNEFSWNNLRPVDAFERLGSKTFEKLFWDYVHGMGVAATDVAEAGEVIASAREKYGYSKWNMKLANDAYTTRDGLTFKPSLADKLSIYAYSQREQALGHMVDGGFTFDTGITYKDVENGKTYVRKKLSTTYRLSEANIKSIINSLTQEQKAYVDAILPYLTDMGKKGNEVSMTLYGIELFGEKVYFPLQSSADYLSSTTQELGATPTMSSLANSGFTKQTKPKADNPIVLRGFDDVVLEHIEKMSNYHGLVIPIENLRRVFDNVSRDTERNSLSTKALIGSRFGVEAQKYFAQLLIDLNGGMSPSGAKSFFGKLFSKGKAMAVSANLSVVAQQYFSIVRAMEFVNPKYFVPFLNGETKSADMKEYEELKKYAPIAIIKEMNGFDVGSSGRVKNYIGSVGARKDAKYIKDKIDDISMWGAGKMDELGWVTIWKAVKAEVASEQKLAPGTEEFYKACNTRFTEVVTKTQVYDSVASRSGYMRSKYDAVKYATSFMGEPTVVMGRYFVNGMNLARAIKSKDSGKIKDASLHFVRAAVVITIAQTLGNLAKSLMYAGRDDEEDEALLEKWAKNFAEALVSDLNPLNSLPFTRDIMSVIEGWDVERPDLTLIADTVTSAKKMFDDDITLDDTLNFIGSVGNLFGVPIKNVIREIKSAKNGIDDIFVDDISPTDMGGAFVEGFTGEERTKQTSLYNAILRGDTSKIEAIKGTYKTDSAYKSAVKQALRDNDSRIKEAAKAHASGDIRGYSNYIDTIVAEGHFDEVTVKSAILAEEGYFIGKINEAAEAKNNGDDAEYKKIVRDLRDSYRGIYSQDDIVNLITKAQEEQLATKDDEDVEEATSIYKASDINDAFESGDTDMALEVIDDLFNTKVENYLAEARKEAEEDGKTFNERKAKAEAESKAKSSIRSSMTSYWKPLYKEAYKSGNTAEKERIERILKASGLYGNASEVIKTCREWRTERD